MFSFLYCYCTGFLWCCSKYLLTLFDWIRNSLVSSFVSILESNESSISFVGYNMGLFTTCFFRVNFSIRVSLFDIYAVTRGISASELWSRFYFVCRSMRYRFVPIRCNGACCSDHYVLPRPISICVALFWATAFGRKKTDQNSNSGVLFQRLQVIESNTALDSQATSLIQFFILSFP